MTIKLSYSILNTWMQGRFEEAVAQYLGKEIVSTPAMELGKIKHELWEKYVAEHKMLPAELGGDKLKNPITETKYQKLIPLGKHQILFRGVVDLEDDNIITDYKVGLTDPGAYLDGWQLDAYKLLRPNAIEGRYLCFNPYQNTRSIGIKYLNDHNAELALENIITFGGELIEYLASQRLLTDFVLAKTLN